MLENYYVNPGPVERVRACWLGPEIESYVDHLESLGYATGSIRRRVPVLCDFAEFARQRRVTDAAAALTQVDDFVAIRLQRRTGPAAGAARYAGAIRTPLQQALRLATSGRLDAERNRPPFPFQDLAPDFRAYLDQERGASPITIERYAYSLGRFSAYLEQAGAGLGAASPALLAAFAIDLARDLSATGCAGVCGPVRVLLRYCHREGILPEDLAGALELPHSYRLAALPRSLAPEAVRQLLAAVDRSTAIGRRDYAILALLVTYGLRAVEVTRLALDDIDWRHDRLCVPVRKAGNPTTYPLAGPVAEALVAYLRDGRPASRDRRVFLRARAPRVPIGRMVVTHVVKRYLRQAGLRVRRPGARTLRHTCVQTLVDAGFAFKAVGDYVGHRSTDSTATYARIDLAALREVALGDGEEL